MSDTVIVVENLSKSYIVGHRSGQRERYTALRDVIAREARNFTRKSVDLFRGRQVVQGDELEEFWALRDVSFEVRQGEVLAVIGRNGAGKSTLLKILSRITEPSCGRAILRGRVASLLEVGTGFHAELNGRENIFLNGVILGMKRAEIKAKFDEIVAFAEVDRFLDTPVKRYSSGMYVRLAFAVAAHLDPEILIIDEVLAVGDAEFQKKCLGKIGDVARGGRTVLFVSHNMAAVKSLTTRGILLDQGSLKFSGTSEQVIAHYAQMTSGAADTKNRNWGKGRHTAIRDVRLLDKDNRPTTQYIPGEPLRVDVIVETDGTPGMSLELFLVDATRTRFGAVSTYHFQGKALPEKKGTYQVNLTLAPLWLASGSYGFDVSTSLVNIELDHSIESAVDFHVQFSNPLGFPYDFKQSDGCGTLALLSEPEPQFVSI
jgi:lipopolysaccharide transport system ATP-binding protein